MIYYGLYKITNLTNGKMYIGQHTTTNLDDGYMGSGRVMLKALKKYGKENFRKEWLMFCEDEEELNYMERVYVDQTWVDRSDTYNLVLGGSSHPATEHMKRVVSEANRKRVWSEQSRMKLKSSLKKVIHGKDWVERSASKIRGRKNTNLSGENNGMYGRSNQDFMTQDAIRAMKEKMSRSKIGNTYSKGKHIGKHWFNNGIENRFQRECPEGFVHGRIRVSKELRKHT